MKQSLFQGEWLRHDHINVPDQQRSLEVVIRLASPADLPAIQQVVDQAVRVLGAAHYNQRQIESSMQYLAGTDIPELIADATYYVAEVQGEIAGCGGWSKRAALYSDAASTDDQPMLDPARDAAKIRQFYVHPRWARRGIARRLLHMCEQAARAAGFAQLELASTLMGEALYGSYGFQRVAPVAIILPNGVTLPVITMVKQIATP